MNPNPSGDVVARSTLLLVDGDTKNLRVLEVSLRKAGYTVITAESGEDALERVGDAHPSLVISDTQLPGIDGYEFCKRLKADSRWDRTPFIFLTHQEALQDKIRGLELGVEEYLTKPIFIKELLIRTKMVLQKKQREVFTDQDGQTTFKGNLADMAVVDLIQTMEMGRKSGVAQFSGDGERAGAVYFREGEIIDAEEGESRGEDAIYGLLGWTDGSFVVEFQTVERARAISESNQGLLMEGMRRVDEWNRIRNVIPDLNVKMVPDEDRAQNIRGNLSPMQSMALALMDGSRSIEDIRGALAMDDLEILTAVRQLVEMGGVRDPMGGSALERVKLEDIPQPKAFGAPVGQKAEAAPALTEEEEREQRTTLNLGSTTDLPPAEMEEPQPRPTRKYGELLEDESPVDLPPEELEDDGELPPMDLPAEEMEEDDELPPPIPPDEEEEDLPPVPGEEPPALDEDEEAAAIEDEDPPPQITAALTDNTEELAGELTLLKDRAAEGQDDPVYLFTPPTKGEEAAEKEKAEKEKAEKEKAEKEKAEKEKAEKEKAEKEKAEKEAAEKEKAEKEKAEKEKAEKEKAEKEKAENTSGKRIRKKKGKKRKKRGAAVAKPAGGGEVIPFPSQPAVKSDSPPAGRNQGGAEPALKPKPKTSVAEAAAAAAARAGYTDPSEASINVVDEEFFNSDYMEDDLAAFDESLIVPAGPPSKLRLPAMIIISLALIGGGLTTYFLVTSPYIGDGPEHLRVDPASLARQEEARRKAESTRRKVAEKEQEAFLSGKKAKEPVPTPVPDMPATEPDKPATEPDKPATEPDKPAAEPDKPATEPDKPATEPDKPATEPDKPAPAPDTPASPGYDTLLAEGKALLKKYKKRNAMKKFQAAVKVNPNGWEAMEHMALYNMELGRMGTAYKLAKKVAELHPDAPYAQLVIGGMLQERGKRSAAKDAYGKFLKLCPNCRYAKDIRAVLKSM